MRAFACALAFAAACTSEPPPGVSSGTGGAVCSFTAAGTMSNLSTTNLASDPITDTIYAVVRSDLSSFKWERTFGVDGGCVGRLILLLDIPAAPTAGASYACGDGSLDWVENYCDGTRGWGCSAGTISIDAVNDSSMDVSFQGMTMMPAVPAVDPNQATGTIALTGSCAGVHLN